MVMGLFSSFRGFLRRLLGVSLFVPGRIDDSADVVFERKRRRGMRGL